MKLRTLFATGCIGLVACGGGTILADAGLDTGVSQTDASQPDATASDAARDARVPFDVPSFDVSIPDAEFACKDPTTCDGGFCCASLVLGAGTPPQCPISSISSACKATCDTQLVLSCDATEQVRFCSKKADCTEAANNLCCLFDQGGQQVTMCTNQLVSLVAKQCF